MRNYELLLDDRIYVDISNRFRAYEKEGKKTFGIVRQNAIIKRKYRRI